VTLAPETTARLASITVPRTTPVPVWGTSGVAVHRMPTTRQARLPGSFGFFIGYLREGLEVAIGVSVLVDHKKGMTETPELKLWT
jgi:hypothetical protein